MQMHHVNFVHVVEGERRSVTLTELHKEQGWKEFFSSSSLHQVRPPVIQHILTVVVHCTWTVHICAHTRALTNTTVSVQTSSARFSKVMETVQSFIAPF